VGAKDRPNLKKKDQLTTLNRSATGKDVSTLGRGVCRRGGGESPVSAVVYLIDI
jgi:hypothetical protein